MSNLKLIILMMNAVLRVVAQQWYMYELVKTFGFTVSNCTEQKVDSMLSCAAIGRVAKAPTYVFIVDKNLCLWDCKSFKNDYPSVENHKWRQYEVKLRKNSALKKPTTGSSVLEGDYGNWDPHYATDGLVQRGNTKIFHSALERFPWIRIDMLETVPILFIRVHNRGDGFGHRFYDVAVEVTNNSEYVQRGFYQGPAANHGVVAIVDIMCDYQTIARYVRLRITKGSENYLNIPELEIYTN